MTAFNLDARLLSWYEVDQSGPWDGLLVGNGASRAVWGRFDYDSLFNEAVIGIAHPLTVEDKSLFDALGTRNFEQVLSSLVTARIVSTALGLNTAAFVARHDSIRRALVEAVHKVHVPWPAIQQPILTVIRAMLQKHRAVFSTNYDLLVYWAIMSEPASFKDFFWNKHSAEAKAFDLTNTSPWGDQTLVYYLHGGLHLYRLPDGKTLKRVNYDWQNLLDLFGLPLEDATPLVVTEGTSADKLSAISRTEYLSFCYLSLAEHEGSLVILGHALGPSDQHLVDAIKAWGERRIAIGLRKHSEDDQAIIQRKAQLIAMFPRANLIFFDSGTHPLTHAALQIPVP